METPFRKVLEKAVLLNRWGTEKKERYRTRDVCQILGIKPDTLRARIYSGRYPEPGRDSAGRRFWTEKEIEKFLEIDKLS